MVWTDISWTFQTICSQVKQNNIEFQPVKELTDEDMSLYVENILLEIPQLPIVLTRKPDNRTRYTAVNSNIPLTCLKMFAEDTPLKGLTVRKELNGKSYSMLDSDMLRTLDNMVVYALAVVDASNDYLKILTERTKKFQ